MIELVAVAWVVAWLAVAAATRIVIGRVPSLPHPRGPTAPLGLVSVVIPARNEARAIVRTVESLLNQSYPDIEIIAVNDGSNDETGSILDGLQALHPRLTVVHNPALRAGWLGKPNAVAAGVARARGSWVLFADADIEFAPHAVEAALAEADSAGLDGISLLPRLITASWSEAAMLPISPLVILALRPDRANDRRPGGGFAAGAFILLKRGVYDLIGGHAAVRSEIIDDVALGKLAKAGGHPFRVYRGEAFTSVRMYTGVRSLFHGMVKNLSFVAGGAAGNPYLAPITTLVACLAIGMPLGLVAWQLFTGASPAIPLGAYLIPAFATLGMREGAVFRFRYVFLYPVAIWIMLAATATASYYRVARGTVRWRNREIPL